MAIASLITPVTAQSTTLSPQGQSALQFGLGAAKQEQWKVAIRYFLDAQQADPTVSKIWFDLGLASAKMPGYEFRAIAWFKAYLLANPKAANAAAVKAEISQLEIAYESRLGALLDALEPIVQIVASNDAATKLQASSLGGWLVAMRLRLGDASGAQKTSASFGITAPIVQGTGAEPSDTAKLIALGRSGIAIELSSVTFDDTSLDSYLAELKQTLSDPTLRNYNLDDVLDSLAGLFESYRLLRGRYGPIAKPDFSSMMFLTGTWNCTQMVRGKSRPDTATTTIGRDGMSMVTQDTAPPFDQYRTVTINTTDYTTYDPTIKQWVQFGADTSGGSFASTSPGWQGNTITWTTKGLDGSNDTDVMTKNSDTQTTDEYTGTDAQGHTTKVTITCNKASS
jgi:hypothetical protein